MDILFQDQNIAVCVKPVGVDSEKAFPETLRNAIGGEIFTVHRLDQNVGGVMLFARNRAAASMLSSEIQKGNVVKEYLAQVHGLPPAAGDWEDFLFKDSRKNKVFPVKKLRSGVKKARLAYCVLSPGERSMVHIRLFTGRSHQIRVQFSSRGYPLVGDHKYGSRAEEKIPMLFSCRITFPYMGRMVSYEALPEWVENENFRLPEFSAE